MISRVVVGMLAGILAAESIGLSRWGAIRLAHWAASHIYAADPERMAKQAADWEKRVSGATPSHLFAMCFALALGGWATVRILTRQARAITDAARHHGRLAGSEDPEGWSPMTNARLTEAVIRWAARREYADQPERAQTRTEEWLHDIGQAAERGLLYALATGLPHVVSALRGPAHTRQRLVIDGDHLMVQFEEGEIADDLLTESVRALMLRAGHSRWTGRNSFEPIRCAAVDRLSAGRAAAFAGVLLTAGMPGEATTVVQAWPVPEYTAHRSAQDLVPICQALITVWPGGPEDLARLLSGSVSHWGAGRRLLAEATIRRELGLDHEDHEDHEPEAVL